MLVLGINLGEGVVINVLIVYLSVISVKVTLGIDIILII